MYHEIIKKLKKTDTVFTANKDNPTKNELLTYETSYHSNGAYLKLPIYYIISFYTRKIHHNKVAVLF